MSHIEHHFPMDEELIVVGDQFFGNYLPTGLRSKALWNWVRRGGILGWSTIGTGEKHLQHSRPS
ncbi:hypothetical protein T01_8064 [Trichinella spiralis]|uniref:Uncharacterized protein n=1 Tax=Trichinella spiralis TaxID=6334 RepID=A0A0V1C1Q4_TRISP|nr:hypothetical protein T01_8064 [Trichinella spiralis]